MCGIAGIIGKQDFVSESRLKVLAQSLAHRGPDDEGIEVVPVGDARDKVVGLVHRRLAIIDLSPAGHQPMKDEVTGNWITFNGEIYNYRELRVELEGHGHQFKSQSDTEVILKSYAQYGADCVKRLRGMFAFALFDARAQKLFIAVDRFGIKPLYFYQTDGVFAFSSEVRALLRAGVVERKIDSEAVQSFLSFGSVQAPRTIIREVSAMLPGQYLMYDVGSGKVESGFYWNPVQTNSKSDLEFVSNLDIRISNFTQTLEDTVRHHLVSDVPVGLFLSGGVDSSALAILASRVSGKTLDSFSVTFEEKEYAEGHLARLVGEKFCARHHELKISDEDLENFLPAALDAQDQPTIDGVNAYVISKAVREAGIKVVLSGQGGDEVFGGYSTFRRIPAMVKWRRLVRMMPVWKRNLLARMIGDGSVARSKLAQYLVSDGDMQSFYAIARQLLSPDDISKLTNVIASEAKQSHAEGIAASPPDGHRGTPRNNSLFNTVSLLELRGYLANTLLRDGDIMSMAHGLEVRVPFLDHVLLERVMSIPESRKISRTLPKPLLLNAVRDEMPHEIWARKKMGFTFPWELWLRGRFKGPIDQVLQDKSAAEKAGLSHDACLRLWHDFCSGKEGITWSRVWGIYSLIRWAHARL
ncbi:asparagine synthase (glutamine-hydrolyzing) [Candidatus Uhrbacteria bacterium]|nr:asparagine synthase (glutamine-hydrolyzing) [Candidatus Uhrbacteria bacterium]